MRAIFALVLITASVSSASSFTIDSHRDDRLTQSACNGDLDRVRRYLDAGDLPADPALFCAIAMVRNAPIADLLLSAGAHPNANYAYLNSLTGAVFQLSMLQFAVQASRSDLVEVLLRHHADINLVFQAIAPETLEYATTALAFAAARGDSAMVHLLIDRQADVNADHAAALFAVVSRPTLLGGEALLKTLLTAGGNPRIRNVRQRTICDLAAGTPLGSVLATGECD